VGIRCADQATLFYPQKLALTSTTRGGRSVGIIRSWAKLTGLLLLLLLLLLLIIILILLQNLCVTNVQSFAVACMQCNVFTETKKYRLMSSGL
jgi:hypothetical protein